MKKKWIVSMLSAACLFTGALGACTTTPAAETPEPEHVHVYAQTWSKDETSHWYAATCGHDEKLALGNHAWGVPEVTKAATETEEGSQTLTCVVCGATKSESIPATGHTHSFAADWSVDETKHWHASTCGHAEVDGEAAHTFGEWQTVIAATHTTSGLDIHSCTVCHYAETLTTNPVDPDLHTYDTSKWASDASGHWFAANCGHNEKQGFSAHNFTYVKADNSLTAADGANDFKGYHLKRCSNCNYEVWEYHDFSDWKTIQEHSCEQDGISESVCDCGFKKTSVNPAGHSFYTTWEHDETHHWHPAGCEHTEEKGAYNPHNFSEGIIETDDQGNKTMTKECLTCGYVSVQPVTGATDFDFQAQLLNSRGSVAGGKMLIEDGVIHIPANVTVNFDFINIQPDEAAATDLKNNYKSIKVYEVAEDGTKTLLQNGTEPSLIQLDWRTASNSDVVFFQLQVTDGQSHKIRVETEFAYKEFTVIPDVPAAIEVQYSVDDGQTWTAYSSSVSLTVGQKILLKCNIENFTVSVSDNYAQYINMEQG